ncbi:hypothetical protein RI129_002643 [Pyrocoelia pectoralis]|uniref:Uncharacterized protein n=1 Tax=Pyrocoelia pectoralis TaxID=417401 RepID=A0AAN7ZTH3_9COLE
MNEDSDSFFEKIENELNVKIPGHLKHLLSLHGFANNLSLGDLSDTDILEIEHFTKTQLKSVIKKEEINKYLGLFTDNTDNFVIFGGEKKLLLKIKEHVNKKNSFQEKLINVANKASKRPRSDKNITENVENRDTPVTVENINEERLCLTRLVKKNIKECVKNLDDKKQRLILSQIEDSNYNCELDGNGNLFALISCVLCKLKLKVIDHYSLQFLSTYNIDIKFAFV